MISMRKIGIAVLGAALATGLVLAAEEHGPEPTMTLSPDLLQAYVPSSYAWELPKWMPKPLDPRDNPTTPAKVELGRRLFYDTRLSVNRSTIMRLVSPTRAGVHGRLEGVARRARPSHDAKCDVAGERCICASAHLGQSAAPHTGKTGAGAADRAGADRDGHGRAR